jgi:hypothetical protein
MSLLVPRLLEASWIETSPSEYRKGSWIASADTNSWWMIGTREQPRVFDVADPTDLTATWTLNLIEHICTSADEIALLKKQLNRS